MGTPFDGNPAWRQEHTLADGTHIVLRPIVPSDKEEMRRAFLAASPRTRYYRFLGLGRAPTEALLDYLVDVDQDNHIALVATMTSYDLKTEEGVGVARLVRLEEDSTIAEAAITVRDDMQRRGIGKILVRALGEAARARGIRTIRAEVLADNTAMRTLLEETGATPIADDPAQGTMAYDIELAPEREKTLAEILRGAAETMALTFRRLLPPSAAFAAARYHGEGDPEADEDRPA